MDKKGIYLITGIVVTVLFWIFRVEVYEGLYQAPGYSDAMYNTGIYGIVGIISAAMAQPPSSTTPSTRCASRAGGTGSLSLPS